MKLERNIGVEVQGSIAKKSHKAKISEKNMHKLWDILQDPYKNPIGAIVREYTSNAWDSHVEAGVTDPIIVTIDKDGGGWFWSVQDFGVGMSEERIEKVFVEYLETTKDSSNNEIGAFGIGSKSGLSYQDIVYYTTIYDGYKYMYALRKGDDAPTLDLLSKEKTKEKNGTTVKIYIKNVKKNSWSTDMTPEVWRFKEECKSQLPYFHNVFFAGCDINNTYKIYEGKTFKSSTLISTKYLHMCIGDVYYPIDFNQLKMDVIECPLALKFNIGDVDLQFTREDVKYSTFTKKAIKEKIQELNQELLDMWNDTAQEVTDPRMYYQLRDSEPFVVINGHEIYFKKLGITAKKNVTFKPFKGTVARMPKDLNEFMVQWIATKELDKRGSAKQFDGWTSSTSNIGSYMLGNITDPANTPHKTHSYIFNGQSDPKRNRIIRSKVGTFDTVYLFTRRKLKLKTYVKMLRLPEDRKVDWRKAIQTYQDTIDKYVKSFSGSYKDIDLDDLSDEDKERFDYYGYRKSNQLVLINILNCPTWGSSYVFTKTDTTISSLFNNRGILIYGEDNDVDALRSVGDIMSYSATLNLIMDEQHRLKGSGNGLTLNARFNVIKLAKANWKYLPQHHNCMHVDKFMEAKMKVIGRIATAMKISKYYGELYYLFLHYYGDFELFNACDRTILERARRVHDFLSEYNGHTKVEYADELYEAAEKLNNFDTDILDDIRYISDFFDDLELLKILMVNNGLRQVSDTPEAQKAVRDVVRYYNKYQEEPLKRKMLYTYE